MRLNNKGFVIEGTAIVIIGIMALFILPQNPISSFFNIGVRQNKVSHVEKVEFIKQDGEIIGTKTITKDDDLQEHATFGEWVHANIILIILAALFLLMSGGAGKLWAMWTNLRSETKKIVVGIDKALDSMTNKEEKDKFLGKMSEVQDTSTKKLVDEIQGK